VGNILFSKLGEFKITIGLGVMIQKMSSGFSLQPAS